VESVFSTSVFELGGRGRRVFSTSFLMFFSDALRAGSWWGWGSSGFGELGESEGSSELSGRTAAPAH